MGTKRTSLDEVRAAKKTLEARLRRVPQVNGVGISRIEGYYCLKVNLIEATRAVIPREVNGVPVRTEVVGKIRARGIV
jgi:hypothetical protein